MKVDLNMFKRVPVVLGMLFVILVSCFYSNQGSAIARVKNRINYNTVVVKSMNVDTYYKAAGTVKPTVESELEAQITAKVIKVFVLPGQKVTKGHLLAILDSRAYISKVGKARQGVKVALAIFKEAKRTYNRIKKLVKSGYLTHQQYDQVESKFMQAQAGLSQAQKSLREANVELSYCKIRAPANGVVLNRFVEPGDQAMPGKVLFQFQAKNSLRLVVNVPEELVSHVKLGDLFPVRIGSISHSLKGVITEIVPAIDPNTRSFVVKAAIATLPGIYTGMFGRLWIPIGQQLTLVIPIRAIHQRGQLKIVYVLVNRKLQSTLITTGKIVDTNMVEVLSGLNAGDRVVVQEHRFD